MDDSVLFSSEGGSEGPRCALLLRQAPPVQAGNLMDESVLFLQTPQANCTRSLTDDSIAERTLEIVCAMIAEGALDHL